MRILYNVLFHKEKFMTKNESPVPGKEQNDKAEEEPDEKEQPLFQKRDTLYDDCENFIESLLEDWEKPWYSVLNDAERISEKIAHTLDSEKLEIYEADLKRLKAEVQKTKGEVRGDYNYEEKIFSGLLWDSKTRRAEIQERKRDMADLRLDQRIDMLYDECEAFIEELIADVGKPWYYSAKNHAEILSEKIVHALDLKTLDAHAKELRKAKEKVKRIKEREEREGY